jgi:CBS domain-containing protein
MEVRQVMQREPWTCTRETNLAVVGRMMAEEACGLLPVLDGQRRVVGVVTARDICLAVATSDQRPSQIQARQIMVSEVFTCRPEDSLEAALRTMRRRELRRLPVVDGDRRLVGMLSLEDIVLAAQTNGHELPPKFAQDVVLTLKAICSHRSPLVAAYG